jgi:hypothetical protein
VKAAGAFLQATIKVIRILRELPREIRNGRATSPVWRTLFGEGWYAAA